MITKKQAYQYILDIWQEYSSNRLEFAIEIVGFDGSDEGECYDMSSGKDKLLLSLFDNCMRIEDGEAAFTKQELEIFWQEIEEAIVKIRQWLKEN